MPFCIARYLILWNLVEQTFILRVLYAISWYLQGTLCSHDISRYFMHFWYFQGTLRSLDIFRVFFAVMIFSGYFMLCAGYLILWKPAEQTAKHILHQPRVSPGGRFCYRRVWQRMSPGHSECTANYDVSGWHCKIQRAGFPYSQLWQSTTVRELIFFLVYWV